MRSPFVDVSIYFAIGIGLVPMLILLFRDVSSRYYSVIRAIKPYFWLLFIGSLYELIATKILKIPSGFWFTLYTYLEFLTLWYFFRMLFPKTLRVFSYLLLILITIGFIFILMNWSYDIHHLLEAYLVVPTSIFVFIHVFLWCRELFKKTELVSLWEMPISYFIGGLFVYFSLGVLPSLLIYQIIKTTGFFSKYWMVFIAASILMRIMMIIGLLKATAKKP